MWRSEQPAKPALSESQLKDPVIIVRCFLVPFPLTGGFFDSALRASLRMTVCTLSDKLQFETKVYFRFHPTRIGHCLFFTDEN